MLLQRVKMRMIWMMTIEVLGYKKSKEKKMNTKKLESLERKLENKINEISYKEFKKDDSKTTSKNK